MHWRQKERELRQKRSNYLFHSPYTGGNLSSFLFRNTCCCGPHTAIRSDRMRPSGFALPFRKEKTSAEERSYQDTANDVDTQCPGSLCITAGANTMNSRERKDAQCQYMQLPPQLVADVRAQPGTDTDSNTQIQRHNTECHPFWTIMTC